MLQVHTVLIQPNYLGVTASLYYLEEYIYLSLYDDEIKGSTDRLQRWNEPRKQHI